MKLFKKIIITALIFVFIVTLTDIPSISNPVTAQAATIKISKKTLSLEVGKTATLTVTGTKKAVKWSSSDKSIATVTNKGNKGKVTAVAKGKVKITATVSDKKLTCTVTVTEPANPYLKDAPFDAQEVVIGNLDFVIPSDWTLTYELTEQGIGAYLKPNDTTNLSSILISIIPTDQITGYSDVKDQIAPLYSQAYFENIYNSYYGEGSYEVVGLKTTDLKVSFDTVLKTEYTLNVLNLSLAQQIYDFYIDGYFIEIQSNNVTGTDLSTIIEYSINSFMFK